MTQPDEDALALQDEFDLGTDIEAPPEDAFEQRLPASPSERPDTPRVPFEADEADAIEQYAVAADTDDDDYR
jgi:hypothetical protein